MTDRVRTRARNPTPEQPPDDLTAAIGKARQGDEQAFRHLYRAVQPRLLNYARAMVGETDAEDVTAETWACIARDLDRFHGDGQGFLGWSATIARHRATDHLRRRRPVTPLANENLPEQTPSQDTADLAEEALTTAEALDLIGRLPTDQAQAILLRVVIGLDAESAARILGKRSGAVRTAAYRGLRTLSRHLHAHDPLHQSDHADAPTRGAGPNHAQAIAPPARRPPPRAAPAEC
jgi:RNA polymerase sigma-70 factor (ECF subfamily)